MAKGQNDLISRFLDTSGDGTGTKNAGAADLSGQRLYLAPAAGQIFVIHRLIASLEDETGFKAELFGKESALGNGILLKSETGSLTVVTDFLDGDSIKTNGQFGVMCFDVNVHNWANTPTDEILLARFTFDRFGKPLKLVGDDSDILVVTIQDDLSAILVLKFLAQGYLETLE